MFRRPKKKPLRSPQLVVDSGPPLTEPSFLRRARMKPSSLDELVRELVDSRDAEIRHRQATVTIEGRLHAPSCSTRVAELVFSTLLDHALARCTTPGRKIRIGWLPSSDKTRVFFLKDDGETSTAELISNAVATEHNPPTLEEIVERHGGSVWREVEPGRGTTFFVILGRDDPPQDESLLTLGSS